MLKKSLGIILLVSIIMMLIGSIVLFAQEKPVFGFFLPTMDNPFFYSCRRGAEMEAERQGVKLVIFDAKNDPVLQLKQVEDAIQQQFDCLLINPVDINAIVPGVEDAVSKGIPVISWDRGIASDKMACVVYTDPFYLGYVQGKFAAEKLGGKGNVVMLSGPLGFSIALERAAGYKAALEEFPEMKIIAERFTPSNPVEGLKNMEDFLAAYAKIDAVYGFCDYLVMGAVQAIQDSGKTNIIVTSFDLGADAEQALREGKIHALAVDEVFGLTEWPVIIAKKLFEGRTIPKKIIIGGSLVTKENIDILDLSQLRLLKPGE